MRKRRPAPTKKLQTYAAARALGTGSVDAVRRAGYRPRSRKSARAIAAKLDQDLRSHAELEAALKSAGVSLERVAQLLARRLYSRKTTEQFEALKLLAKWLGWGAQPNDEAPPAENTDVSEFIGLRRVIADELLRRATSAPPGGDRPAPGPGAGEQSPKVD